MQGIDLKFLAIPDFYKNAGKEIDENGLISKIQSIKPEIAFMMICYSEINDIKFLLEGAGIFAKMRRNHDLNILSNGKILTMNDVQKKFIQDIAHESNVEKEEVRITGPVGSGKTLLGLEAINIKKAHYLKKYQKDKSSPLWDKKKLRVIILIGSTGYENTMLKQQLKNENLKDTNDCELEIATVHPDSGNLTSIFQGKENHESFSHTLIMLDEITR